MSCYKNIRKNFQSSFLLLALTALLSLGSVGVVHAQDGIGDLQDLVPGGADGGGGGAAGGGAGAAGGADDLVSIETSENTRNQGFVGATAPGISAEPQDGFVGAVSEQSGPPLANGSFGGGVNDVAPPTIEAADGEADSFTVTRRSIRARLRPSFSAPVIPNAVVTSRFQNHFSRQPSAGFTGDQYSVTVNNRTAYIRGRVNSFADSQRLERQLRLEPGVYRIVNELSYAR